MSNRSSRRVGIIAIVVLVILLLLLFLTCNRRNTPTTPPVTDGGAAQSTPTPAPAGTRPAAVDAAERLTPATLSFPRQVPAGSEFPLTWTGPENPADFVTIVPDKSADTDIASFWEIRSGASLKLTAPLKVGVYEIRYITSRSRTVLARGGLEVTPIEAALEAPAEVVLGAEFAVSWKGPGNPQDYVTIVAKGAPDAHYGSYVNVDKGATVTLTAPVTEGEAEIRYVAGHEKVVLARRAVRVITPKVELSAVDEAIAGSSIAVKWTGPNNTGDYVTVVPIELPDGKYGNYTDTRSGNPLQLRLPVMTGAAELRYMTGQGGKVLARRKITIRAAEITLSAAPEVRAGAELAINWTGPNHPGDYITVVPKTMPDGQYKDYRNTSSGSPLTVKAPAEPGDAEVRYMAGQGNKVLARIPVKVLP